MAARRPFPLPELSVALWTALLAGLTILGSDLMWVVAMGDVIRDTGAVPHGIPFATAPQADWHNPTALAQVLLSLVHAAGPLGLAALHLVVVAATLSVVVAESRRLGGGDVRTTLVVALVVVGCATPFVVARLPDLSLLPFVVAVALMRRQHAHPSRAVWWLVPLYALWGNLHGGVLVGVAVLGVFLVASRGGGSLVQRALVAVAAALSLLATSAGLGTPAYYVGVLGNEAAVRGTDLWAAPDLGNPLDLAMLAAAAVLLGMCVRRGLPLWEWLATAGMVVAMLMTARNGVWLVLFVAPAAAGLRRAGAVAEPPARRPRWWWPVVGAAAAVSLGRLRLAAGPPRRAGRPAGGRTWSRRCAPSPTVGRCWLTSRWPRPSPRPVSRCGRRTRSTRSRARCRRQFLDFLHDGRVPTGASDVDVAVVQDDLADEVLAGGGWVETGAGRRLRRAHPAGLSGRRLRLTAPRRRGRPRGRPAASPAPSRTARSSGRTVYEHEGRHVMRRGVRLPARFGPVERLVRLGRPGRSRPPRAGRAGAHPGVVPQHPARGGRLHRDDGTRGQPGHGGVDRREAVALTTARPARPRAPASSRAPVDDERPGRQALPRGDPPAPRGRRRPRAPVRPAPPRTRSCARPWRPGRPPPRR